MFYVLITALGIAVCSFGGALIGFLFENIPSRLEDSLTGCAAGIMLSAAVLGLVVPSVEFSGTHSLYIPSLGILCGAAFLSLVGSLASRMMKGADGKVLSRTVLFVTAIAVHHLPEGIAAGVSFGTGDISDAITVTTGIAFQNVPEGMIIIPPLLAAGAGRKKAALIAVISGLVEVIGVFFGYFAIKLSTAILPFALSFAAGTMLFVIADDMVPQTHERQNGRLATYFLLLGFCLMLVLDALVS